MLKLIKNEAEHREALAELDRLIGGDPAPGTEAGDRLELLAHLVEVYEKHRYLLPLPDPVEAIRFRMEQAGLQRRDLVPYIGSASRVSEVLGGRRPLTLKMIRALHEGLGIPAESLLGETGRGLPSPVAGLDWERFPLREMIDRGWVRAAGLSTRAARDRAEELVRGFIGALDPRTLSPACRRQHVRRGSTENELALMAWGARVIQLAAAAPVTSPWRADALDADFVTALARLSARADGPRQASAALGGIGIRLVVERHLPGTHLDGAALLLPDGAPVVALTLRHDRLDNFWFTLCHELAHIALHLRRPNEGWIADDLEAAGDAREQEADARAARWLIPTRAWSRFAARGDHSPTAVLALAGQLGVHPAVVAGRVRREANNYRLLARLVGAGEVRRQFEGAPETARVA